MLQRIVGLVVTAAGVVLALLIGFWALVFLGTVALVAAAVYFVRSRAWHRHRRKEREIIEGDFVVLDDDKHRNASHHDK